MGYIQRWVRDGIYTAMGERWDIYSDGLYTAMGERELRMGEWNSRRQWNMEDGRRHQTFKTA